MEKVNRKRESMCRRQIEQKNRRNEALKGREGRQERKVGEQIWRKEIGKKTERN